MALFVASCLLSVVSWYTTEQGMALYLSPWFAVLASLGIQTALVLTAWLIGLSRSRRALLIAVYAVTALVSIAFSYVSLFTWFSVRERPAMIQRKLYDALSESASKNEALLAAANSEAQKHVLALEEMTAAEKARGFISKAVDSDPYLAGVREAVAKEAQSYNTSYQEGAGTGLRYTAFERYAAMARQTADRLGQAGAKLSAWRAQRKPQDPSEKQLRDYELVHAAMPWTEIEASLHQGAVEKSAPPSYSSFADRTASGQEDLLVAFEELAGNPGGRPLFSLALAAFIDIVIFLLAYAAGPHLAGAGEQRWVKAAAALDAADSQVFLRTFLRKVEPDCEGGALVDFSVLSEGERQLCIAMVSHGLAATVEAEGRRFFSLSEAGHQALLDAMAQPSTRLRARRAAAAGGITLN